MTETTDQIGLLQRVVDNMSQALSSFAQSPPTLADVNVRVEAWRSALEGIIAQAGSGPTPRVKDLLVQALAGMSLSADGSKLPLHDLTQIAALLKSDATLTITNCDFITPLEQACISTAAAGQVVFLRDSPAGESRTANSEERSV